MQETVALLALTHMPHLGSIKIRLLLRHFGSALAALEADKASLATLPGFGPAAITAFETASRTKPWELTLNLVQRHQVTIIPFTDPRYPRGMLELTDHPVLLYVRGNLHPGDSQSIAVVGTRQASVYGKEMAIKLSRDLTLRGFTVVSGLARGIDTHAHQATLSAGGRTIAIIGSGLADIYPRENTDLAERIAHEGALVSEFPMATPPDSRNFPQRNRLVATMTKGTLLIEAPIKSGAMITVHRALAHRRSVFAIPGRADIESFRGNHALIKAGQARLVENGNDLTATFSDLFPTRQVGIPAAKQEIPLEIEEKQLLSKLPQEELSIEEILEKTKLPIIKLNVLLMSLVLKKVIRELPGKLYKRVI